MTTTQTREAARLYRMIADLMDEVVDLRGKYTAMCENASNASVRVRDLERELERERTRADAAEARVAELEASVNALLQSQNSGTPSNGAVIEAIPGVLARVAKRIERDRNWWLLHSGQDTPGISEGFRLGVADALSTIAYLRKHPEEALPEECLAESKVTIDGGAQ